MKTYRAPWGKPLVVLSALCTVICFGITLVRWQMILPMQLHSFAFWIGISPLALVIGAALFAVRGYSLTPGAVLIHRLFWSTRLPLTDLQSAEYRPGVMRGSIRTFGNGGFFSFAGHYYNRALGFYRCFVTDFQKTAVLRFPARTVVLSPDRPEDFVRELSTSPRLA